MTVVKGYLRAIYNHDWCNHRWWLDCHILCTESAGVVLLCGMLCSSLSVTSFVTCNQQYCIMYYSAQVTGLVVYFVVPRVLSLFISVLCLFLNVN